MENKINNPIYYPLLASEEINGGVMPEEEFRSVWSAFDKLPDDRKNILTSDAMPQKIKLAQQTFGLDDGVTEGVSVLVRWLFFGQVDQGGFQRGLQSVLSGFNPGQIEQIQKFVQTGILTVKPQMKAVSHDDISAALVTESLPLLQAITKYEKLSQQAITTEKIKLKASSELVRPSLVNWIKCYRDELGVGFHDSVQRGTFLFRSENCKRLTPPERERVNLILKSIEESYPLPIDTVKSEVFFPEYAALRPQAETSAVQSRASSEEKKDKNPALSESYLGGRLSIFKPVRQEIAASGDEKAISFSSNHVFPAEKESIAVPEPPQAPLKPKQPTPAPRPLNPFRINPVSQVDKKIDRYSQ